MAVADLHWFFGITQHNYTWDVKWLFGQNRSIGTSLHASCASSLSWVHNLVWAVMASPFNFAAHWVTTGRVNCEPHHPAQGGNDRFSKLFCCDWSDLPLLPHPTRAQKVRRKSWDGWARQQHLMNKYRRLMTQKENPSWLHSNNSHQNQHHQRHSEHGFLNLTKLCCIFMIFLLTSGLQLIAMMLLSCIC